MRFLFIGDVVGRAGRKAVADHLPKLRAHYAIDVVVVNGENAAAGFGITEKIYEAFLDAGADAVTLGNHAFDQREALVFIERTDRLVRPVNLPDGTPGCGAVMMTLGDGRRVLVINAQGRIFMPELDCPFRAIDREITACPLAEEADAIIVDFHAEATSEKQALGHFLDSRVSVVVGTHTHVPTADARVLTGGTAYQTDSGMTGDYNSVIGMDAGEPVHRFITRLPNERFRPAEGPATLAGLAVDIDDRTGLATAVAPVRIGGVLPEQLPAIWSATD
ncbi:MAG: TIGR00282 family metallophosphoesterase [Pseudomonadota bacterium]